MKAARLKDAPSRQAASHERMLYALCSILHTPYSMICVSAQTASKGQAVTILILILILYIFIVICAIVIWRRALGR